LLQQGPVSDEQSHQLQTLATAAETLLSLINDVLDISKIEAGKLDLEAIPFDLREVAGNATGVLAVPAQRKGLALRCHVDPEVPARFRGDPARLRQVLLNLVGNAVKFTEKGDVVLNISRAACGVAEVDASPLAAAGLQFEVRDTGVGIPPDRLDTIFEPFAQAGPSTARTHGGTGLGLTISARLVERMGGRLEVRSTPGQGSTFSFRIRLPETAERPPEPVRVPVAGARPDGAPLRLLLVEDNPVNQQVLTLLLERAGHTVELAGNGREALEALERGRFDAVLMDLQMPEMDGIRCTRLIRAREKVTGGRVPIVAVTANALQGERQRCLQAGMDDYLSKPVRGDDLYAAVDRLVGRQTAQLPDGAAAEAQAAPAWAAPLREMGFDPDAVARLVRTFLDTVPGRLAALREAVGRRDAGAVQRAAHTLKGTLAVFAAGPAGDATLRLELAGAGQRAEAFDAALAEVEREVAALVAAMGDMAQVPA
jgi:CheY-like chemotaxis protein/HPt (histidine-containing phosphotransfer) domain-containing protein